MNRIRVLQTIPDLSLGGAERIVVNLALALDRSRIDVSVASLYDPLGTDLEHALEEASIPLFHLGKKSGFDGRAFLRTDAVIRRLRPQVVHTHLGSLRYSLPATLLRRIPARVHTVHNVASRDAGRTPFLHRLACRLGFVPVAIGPTLARDVRSFYRLSDCPMIPNGIPISSYRTPETGRAEWRAREGLTYDEVVFASVGRLTRQKNHALLLHAFQRVHENSSRARLVIAGDGELREDLQRLAHGLGLGEAVRFVGSRTDIPDLLGAVDVFVLSSDWEGNPLAVMEAMAAGRPAIGTSVGAVPDLIHDGVNGRLVAPGSVHALSDTMLEMLGDSQILRRLGHAASTWAAERFDAGLMARRYQELYEHLLDAEDRTAAGRGSQTSG